MTLRAHQRINKFPGAEALTIKSTLYESLAKMIAAHGSAPFSFVPQTFILPAQVEEYEAVLHAEEAQGVSATP